MAEDVVSKVTTAGDESFGKTLIANTYYSLAEFAEAAERRIDMGPGKGPLSMSAKHRGFKDWPDAFKLAREGWAAKAAQALRIAEQAVELVEHENVDQLVPVMTYDVCGDSVDIGRYLSGEPECMTDYPLHVTSNRGRVITLCANVGYSFSISSETIERRGQAIAALALALTHLGHSTEIWLDHTIESGGVVGQIRVLVKGANDTVDTAGIMYALAHPSVQRGTIFAVQNGWKPTGTCPSGVGGGYGSLRNPIHDLPDGTIYLPTLRSGHDVPDAKELLLKHLSELGLINAE